MNDESKIGWGVIGACGIAKRRTIPEGIIPASNAYLAAVMDLDREGAREIAEASESDLSPSPEDLVNHSKVQAVYIGTPNHLHKDQVIAAAQAGKHVLCEKPLANTTAEIREMIECCKEAQVLLGVGFMMRFNVYHQKIARMLKAGLLGSPVHARGQMASWHPPGEGHWRHDPEKGGGGCVTDVGSHVIDVLEMFFGRTKRVFCQTFNRVHDSTVEDTALLQLQFESGVPAIVDLSFAVPSQAGEYVLEVYGSKGAITAKFTLAQLAGGEVRTCLLDDLGGFAAQEKARYTGGYQPMVLEPRNTYQAQIEAFSEAILKNEPAPVPGEDALWNHIVIEAAYESARKGIPVEPLMD